MAAGIGIDLLEIDRLERALERYPRRTRLHRGRA
jgi:phosphopantetheinyl transferase (holo-ACP synthase)